MSSHFQKVRNVQNDELERADRSACMKAWVGGQGAEASACIGVTLMDGPAQPAAIVEIVSHRHEAWTYGSRFDQVKASSRTLAEDGPLASPSRII